VAAPWRRGGVPTSGGFRLWPGGREWPRRGGAAGCRPRGDFDFGRAAWKWPRRQGAAGCRPREDFDFGRAAWKWPRRQGAARRGVKAARAAGRPKPRWHGIVNLAEAFDRIKQTTFRYPQGVMDQYPDENAGKAQN